MAAFEGFPEEPMTGYPAYRTWAEMIKAEIIIIKTRLSLLEQRMMESLRMEEGVEAAESQRLFKAMGAGYAEYQSPAEEGGVSTTSLRDVLIMTALARRAIYGYGMALKQAGLPKEHNQLIQKLQYLTSALMRVIQFMYMMRTMMNMSLFTPMGGLYAIFAVGTLMSVLAYGQKLSGSGI